MRNYTTFRLSFSHTSKEYLEDVRRYIDDKAVRWNEFKATGADVEDLMGRVGAERRSQVVSWGFQFEGIEKTSGDGFVMRATTSANQNGRNVHITGEEGELEDILDKFSELEIEGVFSGERGSGAVWQFNDIYDGSTADELEIENDDDDDSWMKASQPMTRWLRVPAIRLDTIQLSDPPNTVINTIGMKFVPIPSGEFMMGGREEEEGHNADEERLHKVRITRPFFMGMFPVTQGEYVTVMKTNPSVFHGKTLPVEHVTWKDAVEFCRRMSDISGERAAGRVYRLPSEAEWEYSCRAGTETTFLFGDRLEYYQARFCSCWVDEPRPTIAVGSSPPNGFGLFDMHGNVWEWCNDWYSLRYYHKSPIDDPPGPKNGKHHVLRGGSASVGAHECRSAMRGESKSDGPDADSEERFGKIGDFGFRVVCGVQ